MEFVLKDWMRIFSNAQTKKIKTVDLGSQFPPPQKKLSS